jgi:hypothetical protein
MRTNPKTAKELAKIHGVSIRTIYRMRANGELPSADNEAPLAMQQQDPEQSLHRFVKSIERSYAGLHCLMAIEMERGNPHPLFTKIAPIMEGKLSPALDEFYTALGYNDEPPTETLG